MRLIFLLLVSVARLVGAQELTFFFAGDSHYGLDQWEYNEKWNKLMIEDMNALPGQAYPPELEGLVQDPRGLIFAGDLTDAGSYFQFYGWWLFWKWNRDGFYDDFGLNGEGLLNYPLYEGYGNHDWQAGGHSAVVWSLQQRNTSRKDPVNLSRNLIHYSWDWDGVHFIHLNVYAGMTEMAQESLLFLEEDLRQRVGSSGRPVILVQHYAFDAWSCLDEWWTEKERDAFYEVIKEYNVAAIFCGHIHSAEHVVWNGIDTISTAAIKDGEYLVCRIVGSELTVVARRHGAWGSFLFKKRI
ncbi:MAG: metallophosphoesterase [Parachlamydiales bacterium]|nr:metallophosphoesterase [Parachlamydiales bacterium]